jgi:RNA polymerase sigma factor (sigma-70 family)
VAADVTSDVFVGLVEASRHYREEGKAEFWLKQVAVRAALRRKESLTGRWASGTRPRRSGTKGAADRGREHLPFEEVADQIVARLDAVAPEDLLELNQRREVLRTSPDHMQRRWAQFIDLYIAGHGFREIGERMGLTEATARNWLCQIRKYLSTSPNRRSSP